MSDMDEDEENFCDPDYNPPLDDFGGVGENDGLEEDFDNFLNPQSSRSTHLTTDTTDTPNDYEPQDVPDLVRLNLETKNVSNTSSIDIDSHDKEDSTCGTGIQSEKTYVDPLKVGANIIYYTKPCGKLARYITLISDPSSRTLYFTLNRRNEFHCTGKCGSKCFESNGNVCFQNTNHIMSCGILPLALRMRYPQSKKLKRKKRKKRDIEISIEEFLKNKNVTIEYSSITPSYGFPQNQTHVIINFNLGEKNQKIIFFSQIPPCEEFTKCLEVTFGGVSGIVLNVTPEVNLGHFEVEALVPKDTLYKNEMEYVNVVLSFLLIKRRKSNAKMFTYKTKIDSKKMDVNQTIEKTTKENNKTVDYSLQINGYNLVDIVNEMDLLLENNTSEELENMCSKFSKLKNPMGYDIGTYCIGLGKFELFKYLLKNKLIDKNSKDNFGNSYKHWACFFNDTNFSDLLLKDYNEKSSIKNVYGILPKDFILYNYSAKDTSKQGILEPNECSGTFYSNPCNKWDFSMIKEWFKHIYVQLDLSMVPNSIHKYELSQYLLDNIFLTYYPSFYVKMPNVFKKSKYNLKGHGIFFFLIEEAKVYLNPNEPTKCFFDSIFKGDKKDEYTYDKIIVKRIYECGEEVLNNNMMFNRDKFEVLKRILSNRLEEKKKQTKTEKWKFQWQYQEVKKEVKKKKKKDDFLNGKCDEKFPVDVIVEEINNLVLLYDVEVFLESFIFLLISKYKNFVSFVDEMRNRYFCIEKVVKSLCIFSRDLNNPDINKLKKDQLKSLIDLLSESNIYIPRNEVIDLINFVFNELYPNGNLGDLSKAKQTKLIYDLFENHYHICLQNLNVDHYINYKRYVEKKINNQTLMDIALEFRLKKIFHKEIKRYNDHKLKELNGASFPVKTKLVIYKLTSCNLGKTKSIFAKLFDFITGGKGEYFAFGFMHSQLTFNKVNLEWYANEMNRLSTIQFYDNYEELISVNTKKILMCTEHNIRKTFLPLAKIVVLWNIKYKYVNYRIKNNSKYARNCQQFAMEILNEMKMNEFFKEASQYLKDSIKNNKYGYVTCKIFLNEKFKRKFTSILNDIVTLNYHKYKNIINDKEELGMSFWSHYEYIEFCDSVCLQYFYDKLKKFDSNFQKNFGKINSSIEEGIKMLNEKEFKKELIYSIDFYNVFTDAFIMDEGENHCEHKNKRIYFNTHELLDKFIKRLLSISKKKNINFQNQYPGIQELLKGFCRAFDLASKRRLYGYYDNSNCPNHTRKEIPKIKNSVLSMSMGIKLKKKIHKYKNQKFIVKMKDKRLKKRIKVNSFHNFFVQFKRHFKSNVKKSTFIVTIVINGNRIEITNTKELMSLNDEERKNIVIEIKK